MLNQEYLRAMDDEILKDVYFYHNKINNKIDLYTVGCEISEWDGEKIARILNTEDLDEEIIVFNTCAVTGLAQIGSEKVAERLVKLYPNKKIYFVGCGVNYNKEFYEKLGTAIPNADKFKHGSYNCKSKNMDYNFTLNNRREAGLVKIQDGCYHNCTYCIIHKIREHYVVPYEKIHRQIRTLLDQGKYCIQLLGTEIATYYSDGMDLAALCRRILDDFPEMEYLVMGAIDPASPQVEKLIDLIQHESRMGNKLYLCTQSCSDTILKAMGRRHNVARLRELDKLAKAGKKPVFLILQLIVGFPGETDELFQETLDYIKETKPIDYDTIPFSRRKGTPAYDMPNQVPTDVIYKRERIIYDTIKSYTHENDFGSERAFDRYEKTQVIAFNEFRPKNLDKCVIFHEDLYDTDSLIKLFKILPKYDNDERDIVIITDFDTERDKYDLDVNVKLLTMSFGVKVITKVTINDKFVNFISNTYYSITNFSYRIGMYVEFDFAPLISSSEDQIINLFRMIRDNNLDDIEVMTQKLIKSGNTRFLKAIVKNFNVSI